MMSSGVKSGGVPRSNILDSSHDAGNKLNDKEEENDVIHHGRSSHLGSNSKHTG